MSDTPLGRYQRDMHSPEFKPDQAQHVAIMRLQRLYEEILLQQSVARKPILHRMWHFFSPQKKHFIQGVYLWGGVGRGKTYLMDVFYEALPIKKKLRTHFHRFMRSIHAELSCLKDVKDPLDRVAEKLAAEAKIICFDEFFVSDITDAMILANLFKGLFERGVVLVATSNIPPDRLYENGLQRVQFLPAIKLINSHTDVLNVDGGVDYRLRALVSANLYYHPLDQEADQALHNCFSKLTPDAKSIKSDVDLNIEGRVIKARFASEGMVWFDFKAICDGPRSQNDYIEIAKEYGAVVISGVPALGRANDDQARRFVNLIDEFYDRRVKLILSSSQPLVHLYSEGGLSFEFARTVSRLLEMQSETYLALPHRP